MIVRAVRGATDLVPQDNEQNTLKIVQLINGILIKNSIKTKRLISIVFSQTPDIDFCNPATLLRTDPKFAHIPLFCTAEPQYPHSKALIVRVLVHYHDTRIFGSHRKVVHVYESRASELRSDLT